MFLELRQAFCCQDHQKSIKTGKSAHKDSFHPQGSYTSYGFVAITKDSIT